MNDKIIHKLQEFYVLEKFQVAYYEAQLSATTNEYYRKAFDKMVQIEKEHVNFFAQKLLKETGEVPNVTGSLFELAGMVLGESVEFIGPVNTCKLGVKLERKAIDTYRDFIKEAKGYPTLRESLMDYRLDEEFHALWLDNFAKYLQKNSS
ncbi:MAG: ferritin-like domain-containing protein [Desulfitobacterium hafniense]|nr:ferritin-like domain-containing protein [Desulfitobacterium hafniense]